MTAKPDPASTTKKAAEKPSATARVGRYALLVGVGIADVRRSLARTDDAR